MESRLRGAAVLVSPEDRQRWWTDVVAVAGSESLADLTDDRAVAVGRQLSGFLPAVITRGAKDLVLGKAPDDVLLLKGVLPPEDDVEPTPTTLYPGPREPGTRLRELALLAVMTVVGKPYSLPTLYKGRMIQDVVPVPECEDAQSSGGSRAMLEWHVEDAFAVDRCHHLGLLCVRGDHTAVTRLCAARNLDLDESTRAVLRQSRYEVEPDSGHRVAEGAEAVPVLSGPDDRVEIRYDSVYLRPVDPADIPARDALADLAVAVERASIAYTLAQGDLLIIDNRRVVHARTGFTPRFDGRDRWLMRVMVAAR